MTGEEDMKEFAVVYKYKYGSTKKYAEWIAEELGADSMEASETNAGSLAEYRTIIYGAGFTLPYQRRLPHYEKLSEASG
jgi:flavodoxin